MCREVRQPVHLAPSARTFGITCEGSRIWGDGPDVPLKTTHGTYCCGGFSAFERTASIWTQGRDWWSRRRATRLNAQTLQGMAVHVLLALETVAAGTSSL